MENTTNTASNTTAQASAQPADKPSIQMHAIGFWDKWGKPLLKVAGLIAVGAAGGIYYSKATAGTTAAAAPVAKKA
jgi:hypothetical protein